MDQWRIQWLFISTYFIPTFLHTNHHLMLNQWMRNNKNKALKFSSIWLSREPSNWGYGRHFCQSTNHHNDKEHLHPISLNQLWQRQERSQKLTFFPLLAVVLILCTAGIPPHYNKLDHYCVTTKYVRTYKGM